MGGTYPSLAPEPTVGVARPRILARWLRPGVVLGTIVLLLLCSVIGTGIGVSMFRQHAVDKLAASVGAAQGIVLIASGLSFVYILLHAIAACSNDPVGETRPPECKIHACCFIVAKISLMLWIIAIIVCAVVVGKPGLCERDVKDCRLHVLELVTSNLAFLTTGLILTALEACQYPFEIPEQFTTGITCRVSSFGDDLFEQNISSASSIRSTNTQEREKITEEVQQIERRRSVSPPRQTVPGEYPIERRMTPLLPMLPMIPKSTSKWTDKWSNLVVVEGKERREYKAEDRIAKSDSAISLGSDSSIRSEGSTNKIRSPTTTKRPSRPRVVTPSSNIGNESRRSPLSNMRSVEFPDIVVEPKMRFMPSTATKLPLTANPHILQRRASLTATTSPYNRKIGPNCGPILRKPVRLARKRTVDIKIPGAFVDCPSSVEDGLNLEELGKKLEAENVAQILDDVKPKGPRPATKILTARSEEDSTLYNVNGSDRHPSKSPIGRTNALTDTNKGKQDGAPKPLVEHKSTKPLKRLTLGDISPEMGTLFD